MNVMNKNQLLSLVTIVAGMMAGLPEHTELLSKVLVEATNCAKTEGRDQKQLNKLLTSDGFVALCEGKNVVEAILATPEGQDPAAVIQRLFADEKAAEEKAKLPQLAIAAGSTLTIKDTEGTSVSVTVGSVVPATEPADEQKPAAPAIAAAVTVVRTALQVAQMK